MVCTADSGGSLCVFQYSISFFLNCRSATLTRRVCTFQLGSWVVSRNTSSKPAPIFAQEDAYQHFPISMTARCVRSSFFSLRPSFSLNYVSVSYFLSFIDIAWLLCYTAQLFFSKEGLYPCYLTSFAQLQLA